MHITQAIGSRNFSLEWRNGHVTGGRAYAKGTMLGNHSMKTANNTPHFNWGVDFEGMVHLLLKHECEQLVNAARGFHIRFGLWAALVQSTLACFLVQSALACFLVCAF
jgi:hypothetical protein